MKLSATEGDSVPMGDDPEFDDDQQWMQERMAALPRGSDGKPVAFHDLASHNFPFRIDFHDEATGDLLWQHTVHEPGALKIPGLKPRRVRTTVTFLRTGEVVITHADGSVTETTVSGS